MTELLPESVLDFWFAPEHERFWFAVNPAFDEAITKRFRELYENAKHGKQKDWNRSPHGALALVIILDQFPRNMFRGSAQAFATDTLALHIAAEAIEREFDQALNMEERRFLYMPYMHSEILEDQKRGLALYAALGHMQALEYMQRHHDIIVKFSRFPHRNAILGRNSTEKEREFLAQLGSSF